MMKVIIKNISIMLLIVVFLGACKQDNKNEAKESDHNETQQRDSVEKSRVTEIGQHIGNNTDSTSVDGEPGNPSNN